MFDSCNGQRLIVLVVILLLFCSFASFFLSFGHLRISVKMANVYVCGGAPLRDARPAFQSLLLVGIDRR